MHFYCHSFRSPVRGVSARWEQGLFASPARKVEQHWAAVGGSGGLRCAPCTGEGCSTPPTSLPPLSLCCLKGNQFSSQISKKKKICFRKTLDHIKIQVVLSELENQVLYISL